MAKNNVPHPHVKALEEIASRVTRGLGEEHKAGSLMQSEIKRIASKAAMLDDVRRNPSETETPAAHTLKVGKLAQQFDREMTGIINRLGDYARAGQQDIERRIAEKVDLRPNAFADEVRKAFREMKREERLSLLKQFVEENNGPYLAAIVKAPGFLSGVPDAELASYERSILSKHASAELAEREALDGAFEASITAIGTASRMARQFADPRQLAEIERSDAIAKAAVEAFTQI